MIPGFTVMAPKDEEELRRMIVTALAQDGPVAVRFPRGKALGVELSAHPQPIPIGSWEMLREGADAALLAVGPLVHEALSAAEMLAQQGIHVAVINARFIRPLDEQMLLTIARKTPLLITLEENTTSGGFGGSVAEFLSWQVSSAPQIRMLGLPDCFVEHGSIKELRARYGLDATSIAKQVAADLSRQERRLKIV